MLLIKEFLHKFLLGGVLVVVVLEVVELVVVVMSEIQQHLSKHEFLQYLLFVFSLTLIVNSQINHISTLTFPIFDHLSYREIVKKYRK